MCAIFMAKKQHLLSIRHVSYLMEMSYVLFADIIYAENTFLRANRVYILWETCFRVPFFVDGLNKEIMQKNLCWKKAQHTNCLVTSQHTSHTYSRSNVNLISTTLCSFVHRHHTLYNFCIFRFTAAWFCWTLWAV
jgi:hypothetical protein